MSEPTIQELRMQHTQTHHDKACTCGLWYVPTPVAVNKTTTERRGAQLRSAAKKLAS